MYFKFAFPQKKIAINIKQLKALKKLKKVWCRQCSSSKYGYGGFFKCIQELNQKYSWNVGSLLVLANLSS